MLNKDLPFFVIGTIFLVMAHRSSNPKSWWSNGKWQLLFAAIASYLGALMFGLYHFEINDEGIRVNAPPFFSDFAGWKEIAYVVYLNLEKEDAKISALSNRLGPVRKRPVLLFLDHNEWKLAAIPISALNQLHRQSLIDALNRFNSNSEVFFSPKEWQTYIINKSKSNWGDQIGKLKATFEDSQD
ncbi:hypothetical protein [Leptolyngbya iicbica]|uniref:Uncharacterized protein n=2 Tax=Cyanophyceae TaxID=3028117 RepID=A0A4V2E2B9_9CYAN|nr:hypothetical protein DYY88_14670 [Leptolyngbya sp. LK]